MANILSTFWSKILSNQTNVTKQPRRIPTTDRTDSLQVNKAVTYGVYHNQYEDMKLAGSLAWVPIQAPVSFMGLPSMMSDDEVTQERLTLLVDDFSLMMTQMHMECHRDGTVWVFPFYDRNSMSLRWEFISDECVSSIIRNIDTNEIIKLTTTEMLKVTTADDKEVNTKRIRVFTKTRIIETFEGEGLPTELHQTTRVNVAGVLPINFTNNADLNEVRGHSDLERIIHDLKAYHDLEVAKLSLLSKFKPKMHINTPEGFDTWMDNNGYTTIQDIDLNEMDLIVTASDSAKVEFIFPSDLSNFYTDAEKTLYRKIVEGSGVPEPAWGAKITGNNATVQENMSTLLNFIRDKQSQKTQKYVDLFTASLRILRISEMTNYAIDDIKCEWGTLDGVSAETKSVIFKNFADAVSKLVANSSATKEQLFKCWQMFYPEQTEGEFEEFEKELSAMAKHSAFARQDYADIVAIEPEE